MRRTALILASLSLVLGLAAPVAYAQRDPFEPAIETGEPAPGEEQPAPGATAEPGAAQSRPEPLADTGAEGGPWLALSYILVAFGVAMLVLSRIRPPGRK